MSLPPPQAEEALPYFKRPFGRQFLFQKWKKTYQWSQLGKIDPKRLSENCVNLKVIWEMWQIVYKTICTAINQLKKQAILQLLWGQQNAIRSRKKKAVTKNIVKIGEGEGGGKPMLNKKIQILYRHLT